MNDQEGASAVSFDTLPQSSLEEMVQGQGAATYLASYDETALCSTSFRWKAKDELRCLFNDFILR